MPKKSGKLRHRAGLTGKHRILPGAAPGKLNIDPNAQKPEIQATCYGPDHIHEVELDRPEEIKPLLKKYPTTWIHVVGLGDSAVLKRIAEIFDIHPLALEDVVNQHQRPKLEEFDDSLFFCCQALGMEESLPTEQVNVFWGRRFVVTFQERPTGRWNAVRDRLRRGKTRIRTLGPDYLAYALIDAVVDRYFPVLEQHIEQLTTLEDEITSPQAPRDVVQRLSAMKHDLLALRRAILPLREALDELLEEDVELVSESTRLYLRDSLDHARQLKDLVEAGRDLALGLMNVHISMVGLRTNEIMRVLTIIATIFIPLTFIAGIYGMNFAPDKSPWNMPELHWRWGYPAALAVMALVAGGLLVFFRRKGWLGGDKR